MSKLDNYTDWFYRYIQSTKNWNTTVGTGTLAQDAFMAGYESLEAENANLKERIFMKTTLVDSLMAENSKLRECVEFYAVSKKYQGYSSNKTGEYEYYHGEIINDSGERARQVLKELTKGESK